MRVVLFALTLLAPVSALAQQANSGGFLQPYDPNAYGPGINSDATGRPFILNSMPWTILRICDHARP